MDKTPVKGCESIKFGCDAYWECAVRMQTAPENHQAGSCKMGPRGDPSAVVDNLLQVFDSWLKLSLICFRNRRNPFFRTKS